MKNSDVEKKIQKKIIQRSGVRLSANSGKHDLNSLIADFFFLGLYFLPKNYTGITFLMLQSLDFPQKLSDKICSCRIKKHTDYSSVIQF